jgi:hypothetical protein
MINVEKADNLSGHQLLKPRFIAASNPVDLEFPEHGLPVRPPPGPRSRGYRDSLKGAPPGYVLLTDQRLGLEEGIVLRIAQ